jgi:hypothetical protein
VVVVTDLVVVVAALLVVVVGPGVVVLAGMVVELAESVVVTGTVVVVVTPAATTMRGDAFGITASKTIMVTTPSATTTIARRLVSEGSKARNARSDQNQAARPRGRRGGSLFVEIGWVARTSGR